MSIKRGISCLVLLFLLLNFVLALEATKYQNIIAKGDDDYDNDNDNYDASFENDLGTYARIGCNDGPGWPAYFYNGGCYFFGVEEDSCGAGEGANDDAYGYKVLPYGTITSYDRRGYHDRVVSVELHDDDDYENVVNSDNVRVVGGQGLCGDNKYWNVCTLELAEKGKSKEEKPARQWANNKIYECVEKEGLGIWKQLPGEDVDHDGITNIDDCDDNPTDDLSICKDITSEDCSSLEYSTCAICINPSAVETCGDGVDNDCNADTFDDCNKFKEGCEQVSLPPVKKGETAETPGLAQRNIHGESYSWIATSDGGYCCGFNGAVDLGKILDSSKKEGNYVCLNKNLVGYNGKDLTKEPYWGVKISDSEKTCQGDWCWVNAMSDAAFHILTITKAGEPAYDLVSNSDKWMECKDGNSVKDISQNILGDKTRNANRFTCYQEGNHFSWADCRAKEADEQIQPHFNGIKERGQGDGMFALPIDSTKSIGNKVTVEISKLYESYYGEIPTNFIPPDGAPQYLEFYVRFTKDPLSLPANVYLGIYGPKQQNDQGQDKNILYFDQDVLGYATNNPTLALHRWMHVKIPVPALRDVKYLEFRSAPEENEIEVRNVYLTYGNNPSICSGEYSDFPGKSAWLSDMDYFVEGEKIKADKLCNVLYDPQSNAIGDDGVAWLGGKEVTDSSKHCCGNNEHEYYAGLSKDGYGCWNSQPIKGNQTVMDVAFTVGYTENQIDVTYPDVTFDAGYVKRGISSSITHFSGYACPTITCDDIKSSYSNYDSCHSITKDECTNVIQKKPGLSCKVDYYYNVKTESGDDSNVKSPSSQYFYCDGKDKEPKADALYESVSQIPIEFEKTFKISLTPPEADYYTLQDKTEKADFNSQKISLSSSPLKIAEIPLDKNAFATPFSEPYYGEITITNNNPDPVYVYFVDPLFPNDKLDKINAASMPAKATYHLMAEVTPMYKVLVSSQPQSKSNTFTYSCMQSECLYPLPGLPPYTITNPHPELYELYFVTDSKKEHDVLITNANYIFNENGNLKVKKAAQQVVYGYSEDKQAFYGCQAASYLEGNDKVVSENNLGYCSIAGNKFCSHSIFLGEGKDKYTAINSWSDEKISKVGYLELKDVNTVADIPLQLKDVDPAFGAEKRNYTAMALPARNFISNAEFKTNGLELPHWQILISGGSGTKEGKQTKDGTVVLDAGEKLRSEKIAVAENVDLYFSQNLTCDVKLMLVDRDGLSSEATLPQFNTGLSSYVVVEFTGPCHVRQPMLQRVDELGISSYYTTQTGLEDDARSGTSCCPQNYCWNGYACVEPMSSQTYLAEHISEGRDYRCIAGKWEHLPLKLDWNADLEKWGFCPAQDDCLVLGSHLGGNELNSIESFYEGKYPTCVRDKDYIFDHYCEKGNWTSRTKFIASTLLDAAKGKDYTLYCSNYKESLVSLSDNELSYVAGIQVGAKPTGSLDTLGQTQDTTKICFKSIIDSNGKTLVPDSDNTCANNFCVLKINEGDTTKVAFATTLNKNITDQDSFLAALNIPQQSFDKICKGNSDKYVECDLKGLDLKGKLWYNDKIHALIYSKNGVTLSPSFIDKVKEFFKGLFGQKKSELSDESLFVTKAVNFKDLYILKEQEKKVRAVREVLPEKQTLIAEYENFNTSVCDYYDNLELPPEAKAELLEKVTSKEKVSCTTKENKQRVEAVAGLDFFWRQMTGKMRTESK